MKKKILINFVDVIAAAILLTTALMAFLNYSMFKEQALDNLQFHAQVFRQMLEKERDMSCLEEIDGDIRITIVEPDGTVSYDRFAQTHKMENHAERPEIQQARESGEGRAVRNSSTFDKSTFYYALLLQNGSVLRVAEETDNLLSIYNNAIPLLLILMALMMGVCVWVARKLTTKLIEPVVRMTEHLDESGGVESYPELEPFMTMIQKQHEEILRSANMRVEFTANVSHELKTPLTSISGYAELIESGMARGEQAGRFAHEIRKSANRLLTLIEDIIKLSRMDSPVQELSVESVDLAAIAASTIEQLDIQAQRMGVTLQMDAKQALVTADRRMMEELVFNLMDNAIRYNVRGGSARLEVYPTRDHVVVRVQDTGIGISKENQEHIFERFYRVDKSRSKATGGTGLGLAIVKHIAVQHDAAISVDSELGRGTTITVTFNRQSRA